MKKPKYKLDELKFGKIFQISPEGLDPIQVDHGGDFLISTEYFDGGVQGYVATVHSQITEDGRDRLIRANGLALLRVEWKHLELVGETFWFKKTIEETNGKEETNGNGNDAKSSN